MSDLNHVIGVRFSDSQVQKLDYLAAQTHRGRLDVIRLLIERAQVFGQSDLVLDHGFAMAGVGYRDGE